MRVYAAELICSTGVLAFQTFKLAFYIYVISCVHTLKFEASDSKHILYRWNDDYRQFVIFPGMTVLVNLDYSVPGLVVADEKKKKKLHPRTGFAPGAPNVKELFLST